MRGYEEFASPPPHQNSYPSGHLRKLEGWALGGAGSLADCGEHAHVYVLCVW